MSRLEGLVDLMERETTSARPGHVATAHMRELAEAIGCAQILDLAATADACLELPSWPHAALGALVGPPGLTPAVLDLDWLHRFEGAVTIVNALTTQVGGPPSGPDGVSLLVERAALLGHGGRGNRSAGGSCRLVSASDGWVAVNLPRQVDLDSVAAWLECSNEADAWDLVHRHVGTFETAWLIHRAELLGLAVSSVPGPGTSEERIWADQWVLPAGRLRSGNSPLKVVDLSALWAGPLCGWYLARAGADVVKVESSTRPDGGAGGSSTFYQRLNDGKRRLVLDFSDRDGRRELSALVADADVVISACRPRALEALGLDPTAHVDHGGIWCSITGYGYTTPDSGRVAFGDDAAAAGGLVTFVGDEPWFVGDAAADPISGVAAASGVLALWATARSGFVDVSMRDSVAALTTGVPVRSRA